jgi:hypothetical protein
MNEPWRAVSSRLQTIGLLKPEKVSRGIKNEHGRTSIGARV